MSTYRWIPSDVVTMRGRAGRPSRKERLSCDVVAGEVIVMEGEGESSARAGRQKGGGESRETPL